jgi:hypothetical protein
MNRNGNPTTLKLDAISSRLLAHVAETWGVSEEEAIRRALEQANAMTYLPNKEGRLKAFTELQRRLSLTSTKAADWQAAVREARR